MLVLGAGAAEGSSPGRRGSEEENRRPHRDSEFIAMALLRE